MAVHRELKRKHVILSILWEEYIAVDAHRYSRFCELYRAWEGRLSVTMRQAPCSRRQLSTTPATAYRWWSIASPVGAEQRRSVSPCSVELHLRASDMDAGSRRLDQRPCRHLGGDRRRAGAAGARQYQARGHQGEPLRPADQSHLCEDSRALQHGRFAGATTQVARQGQVEQAVLISSAGCSAAYGVAPSTASPRSNAAIGELLTRAQRGTADPAARRDAPPAARRGRSAGAQAVPASPYVLAEWRIRRISLDYQVEVEKNYYCVPHRFRVPRSRWRPAPQRSADDAPILHANIRGPRYYN
ncbi:hypothetical protein ACVIIV_003199 [Bradyrhizobium sp. USDA 4354]